jgi:DNA-binding response OmpR family regulator
LIEDKIEGYQRGADDYIVKPFNMKELLLKLDVFLRRTKKLFSETKDEFHFGKLYFSYTDLKFTSPVGSFNLKQKEADLLRFLCMHANRILKREEILLAVWGKDDYFLGRSMDVFMSKLRKYLKEDPNIILETIHGLGYRFTIPS